MLDKKLLRYYVRIADLPVAQDLSLSLQQIADSLFTSTRYARTLLSSMQVQGWLIWQPKVGRSQKSILHLKYTVTQLQQTLASQLIQQGDYQQALSLVDDDKQVFGQLLAQTSGAVQREGSLHIQLTYGRQFASLLPHHPLRNGERFFVRQIYSCLVSCDGNGTLEGQLAHHWQHDGGALQWLFYLRPQLQFHDASKIDAVAVVELFKALKALPEYQQELAHVDEIYVQSSLCIGFRLNQRDNGFAALLADIRYSIQPVKQLILTDFNVNADTQNVPLPIGCGAFKLAADPVARMKLPLQSCLRLQAFNQFYACRALIDSVTVWLVREFDAPGTMHMQKNNHKNKLADVGICSHYLSVSETETETQVQSQPVIDESQYSQVEDGSLLLLFNQNKNLQHTSTILSKQQCAYLSELLHPNRLMAYLQQQSNSDWAVLAQNILPQWLAVQPLSESGFSEGELSSSIELPEIITLAVFDHAALQACRQGIVELLAQVGVECLVQEYTFAEFQLRARQGGLSEQLVLTSLNLDDNRASSAFRWFYANSVLQQCLSSQGQAWLQNKLINIRQNNEPEDYLTALEPIATALIYQHQLLPLFHHKQTLNFEGLLKGVAISCWGWPLIKDVWTAD